MGISFPPAGGARALLPAGIVLLCLIVAATPSAAMTYTSRTTPSEIEVPLDPIAVEVAFYAETHCEDLTYRPAMWLLTGVPFVTNATLYEPVFNFTRDGETFRANIDYVSFDWERQGGTFTKWTAGGTARFLVHRSPLWEQEEESDHANWLPSWNRQYASCVPYLIEEHVDENPYFRLWAPALTQDATPTTGTAKESPGASAALALAGVGLLAFRGRRR